ncbi:hypothetical protein EV363DRAFT_1303002 [Boletus edulis]|nr:hypothetical protein EV363DRAFT_1303002 [Boletus edulis]
MVIPPHPDPIHSFIDNLPRFSLDMSGVTGLLRGDDAVSAITTVHVYGNRRWLGWYNTPGSFQLANRFSSFAKSASFRGIYSRNLSSKSLSESVHLDPTTLFEPDSSNCRGPRFRAAHSGTVIEETGYLAALLMKECAAWEEDGRVVPGRRTQPVEITIADLRQAPPSEVQPAHSSVFTLLAASVPIATSISTCTLCAMFQDWCASSSILIGIVVSGVSCLVLGSAHLVFIHPVPAKGSPTGDGILGSKKDIVLLRGTEGAVSSITGGQFSLHFPSEAHYNLIQCCSLLFFIQCVTQFLLIPQASLFGQVMFLTSHGVSALYNAWLSSLDKDKVHRRLLFEIYVWHPPTAVVPFVLLVLQPTQDPTKLLDELLPNDTEVWKRWKGVILGQLRHSRDHSFLSDSKFGDVHGFTQQEQGLLDALYEDARAAYSGYKDYIGVEPL